MREKRLITFWMAPKKSKRQGSEKEATIADGWKKSKLSDSEISSLVSRRLLRPRAFVQWHSAEGHARPFERVAETVVFKAFVERGLAIPVCDFFRGLLFYWGIQLHHQTPNSILHIAIFVHLCEAFPGIYPHFDIFKSIFFLNLYPNFRNVATVGGANLELRPEMVGRYIYSSLSDWWLEGRVVLHRQSCASAS
jgi:hypothetical protein